MIGNLTIENEKVTESVSSYQPSKEVADLTLRIKKDYQVGYDILHRPFEEFNDMSLIERMNVDQKAFNSYVQPKSSDPDESWRWNGVRPITRNKIISTCAHLIAGMLYPGVFAQNDEDEEDRESAYVMRDMIEWNIKNSDYELSFLYGVLAGLVNPVAYIHVDYAEVFQTIKEKSETGEITPKQVIDEVLSFLQYHNVPADEVMIANPYEYHLQRQRFIIRRRFIDYDEAKALHGGHDNFKHVQLGIKALYNESDAMFYDQMDENIQTLVEEAKYFNRRDDTEVVYMNGIYLGNENVENNPVKHRDNRNRPKYPYVKYGAEPIDEKRFYFYKSLAAKMANDQEATDQMWRMSMDGTFLEVMTPVAIIGGESLNTNIMFPGSVTNFPKDTQVEALSKGRNLAAGWNAVREAERSITESSQAPERAGISEGGGKTAYEIAKIEQNARINLGIIGTMIVKMVKDLGELTIDNIIKHQTVGHLEEIVGGEMSLKYKKFLLPDKTEAGKKVTKKIIFANELMNKKMTKKERLKESFRLMEKEGGIDGTSRIYMVNPMLFSRLKFMITIEPESWLPKNERFETLLKLETYDRLIANPLVDQEAVTRDFLLQPLTKGDADKYLKKQKGRETERMENLFPPQKTKATEGPVKRPTVEALLKE